MPEIRLPVEPALSAPRTASRRLRRRPAVLDILAADAARLQVALDALKRFPGEWVSPEKVAEAAGYPTAEAADEALLELLNENAVDVMGIDSVWTYRAPAVDRFIADPEARLRRILGA